MEGWLHFASLHGCIDTSLTPVRMDILDFGHRNIMVWSSISTSSTSGRTDLNSVDLYSLHLLVIPSTDMQTINIVQEGHVYQIHIPLVRIGVRPVVAGGLRGPKVFRPMHSSKQTCIKVRQKLRHITLQTRRT